MKKTVVAKSLEQIRAEAVALEAAMDAEIAAYIADNEAKSATEATPTEYVDESGNTRKIDLGAIAYMRDLK